MIYFKACPRCRGDIYLNRGDQYGRYLQCFQCGYQADPPDAGQGDQALKTIHTEVDAEAA
ncbi:MAG: hypothetical protein V3S37_05785 [Dehalococcoidia bacterium]